MRRDDAPIDYDEFIRGHRVDSRIYTSEAIFEEELERIYYRHWVYLAHDSEVPSPGDYCLKVVGRIPLILTRGDDGELHVLTNRCRHRGNAVCQTPRGRANTFRCPYHGWTYRNNGDLVGIPYPKRSPNLDKSELGLTPVHEVATYRGFIFVRVKDTQGPSLAEHLGGAREFIDNFADASPEGRVEVRAGVHKGRYRGNWKFVGMDGYHTNFTHKSLRDLQRRTKPGSNPDVGNTDVSPNRSWDLGNGHCRLDFSQAEEDTGSQNVGTGSDPVELDYQHRMVEVHGSAASEVIRRSQDPHVHIWPNLQIIGVHIRVVRPIAADVTEVDGFPATLVGVSDSFNERRLRAHEWFYGPAGFGQPDDYEIFERNRAGLDADLNPWMEVSRGWQMEVDEAGSRWGNITDETPQRAQLRAWVSAMSNGRDTSAAAADTAE